MTRDNTASSLHSILGNNCKALSKITDIKQNRSGSNSEEDILVNCLSEKSDKISHNIKSDETQI